MKRKTKKTTGDLIAYLERKAEALKGRVEDLELKLGVGKNPKGSQLKVEKFPIEDLKLVWPAPPPDDPPLAVGDLCRLNSGGPVCLVTQADSKWAVTIGWSDGSRAGSRECALPRGCVRRV